MPADRDRMRLWNEFGAGRSYGADARLSGEDETRGLIGGGLARILGLCAPLKLDNCATPRALRRSSQRNLDSSIAACASNTWITCLFHC